MSKTKIVKRTLKMAKNNQLVVAAVVIVVVGALGIRLLIGSHAASPYASVEAESGTLDTGGIAQKVSSAGASGGSYVQFGKPASSIPPNITGVPLLGLWANGSGTPSQLGVTQQVLTDFASPGGGSGTFTSYSVPSTNLRIMLAVGDLSSSEASNIGGALVSSGHANTIFRVMVEQNNDISGFNSSWNELKFTAAQYVAAFQSVVTELRAVPGNQFTFIWNPNAGEGNNKSGETTYDTWPGAAYVNYVGVDVYDYSGYQANTQEIVDFATGHPESGWPQLSPALPLAFPEWGLNGSDDPAFINYMSGVMKANNTAVESYFSCGPSEGCSSPNSDITQFPQSLAAYKSDFAGQ